MQRGAFGKRQGLPSSTRRKGNGASGSLQVLDFIGLTLLSVLGYLVIDGSFMSGHSANAVIDFILLLLVSRWETVPN